VGHRLAVSRLCVLALLVTAIWAVGAGAASQASPRTSASALKLYRSGQVMRAFKASGIQLVDPFYGSLQPVTVLTTVEPYHGWNVAAYVYPTQRGADQTFNGNIREWRASGFAARQVRNVVVTVVPKGRTLGVKARPFAMPAVVAKTLTSIGR
jgi:hypothetical protein